MSDRISETYDSLWGELMFVMHNPDHLFRVNEGRADWFQALGLGDGLRICDLGCGNGFFDIVLGRRGHGVVGVDRVTPILVSAQALVEDESVEFIRSDLREVDFPVGRFDVVCMFGLVGLMSKRDDTDLVRRAHGWLGPGGALLVDCDLELAEPQTTYTEHESGTIHWNWTSDAGTRTNRLVPELHRRDGTVVELDDPIDPARAPHEGLIRYIYPEDELALLLERAGFDVSRVGHYFEFVFPDAEPSSYMLLARR